MQDRPGLHGFERGARHALDLFEVLLFQRGSGAPVMYQEEPLSATINP